MDSKYGNAPLTGRLEESIAHFLTCQWASKRLKLISAQ
jgi:hypothetical protein